MGWLLAEVLWGGGLPPGHGGLRAEGPAAWGRMQPLLGAGRVCCGSQTCFAPCSPNSFFSLEAQPSMEEVAPMWLLRNCTAPFSLNSLPNELTESCVS